MDLVETLCWLIDIPSVTGEERRLRDEVGERLSHLPQRRVEDSLVVGSPEPDTVLLVGHLDTVPLQGDLGARVLGDRVHGLGATDMKGGLAVMIHLLEELGTDRLAGVFYAGEEGPLANNQLGAIFEEMGSMTTARAGVVMEPTDLALEAGCQGAINADIVFEGEPAHSARPWLGDNAVTKAGEFLTMMRGLEPETHVIGGLEFREVMTVTTAHGGVAKNIVPSSFTMNVNYRFAPDRDPSEAVNRLKEVCAAADRVVITDLAPAGSVDVEHPLFQEILAASGALVLPKQGWTDVAQLTAVGVPAVNFGPGEPSLAHKPGESVRISDLHWAYDSLLSVLR
ncbi:MAG: succinyl-diaminopimelate desuccinylase [Acidimicrobiia bacterium]